MKLYSILGKGASKRYKGSFVTRNKSEVAKRIRLKMNGTLFEDNILISHIFYRDRNWSFEMKMRRV